ncbi:unnamed protein product [Lymnaea stagnalis]|uniref:Uncharacterized protein n=1 Tax=Lymnaea stagnalis TaxID=6523 RepID=A0AAV2HM65_LYMST
MQKEKIKSTVEENRRLRGFLEQKAVELEHLLDQLGDDVIKDDLGFQSSLLHKKVLELRGKDGSPGKLSVKSCSTLEVECSSNYSENSATTSLYVTDDSPPTTSLLKNRFQNSKLYSEGIEMAGVRSCARKGSVTIPPPAEDEKDDDPFGGVYLGPSESSDDDSEQKESKKVALGERQPLMAGTNIRILPYKTGNAASSESVFDVTAGAQGLMTSFGSVDTNPGNLVCS